MLTAFLRPLELMLDTAEKEGFLKTPHRKALIRCCECPGEMLDLMVKKRIPS